MSLSQPEKKNGDVEEPRVESPVDEFDRFSSRRKLVMVVVIAWTGLLSPMASTSVLSAIPNVASTYNTSGSVIGLSNALYLVFMALSPCFWGPWCQTIGRRMVRSNCFLSIPKLIGLLSLVWRVL